MYRQIIIAIFCLTFSLYAAEIYIHYDTGIGNYISVRGKSPSLNWDSGDKAVWNDNNIWSFKTPESDGGFEFKPLINDQMWSTGSNYQVPEGDSIVHIYPFFGPAQGHIITIANFTSKHVKYPRTLRIYLPPSYYENVAKKYPVVYMHDAQNLFDPKTAFGGVEWQVDENMDSLIQEGRIREAIIVAMDNTPGRMSEYTPVSDPKYGGGEGDLYLDFVEKEVMPYININYRTLTGTQNTFIMGSSLGGLISFYAIWKRHHVFGAAGCVSSSFWWSDEYLTKQVAQYSGDKPKFRVYIDIGGNEGSTAQTQKMFETLQKFNYQQPGELLYVFDPQGHHNEASWAKRVYRPLEFLLKR